MAKNILVIGKSLDEGGAFGSAEHFVQSVQEYTDDTIEFAHFHDITFHLYADTFRVINERSGKDLQNYDLVFFRDWFSGGKDDFVLSIALYLEYHKVPVLNKEAFMGRARGKLSQHVLGQIYDAPFPDTFCGSQSALMDFVKSKNFFGFPCIVKASNASRGRDNFLVHNRNELLDAYRNIGEKRILVQEFIANSSDFRVLVFEDQARMVIERKRPAGTNGHLNNTSQGAIAEQVPVNTIPDDIIKRLTKISAKLGRTFTGIDIIEDDNRKGRFVCLEINNMPQVETGALTKDKMQLLAEIFKDITG